MYFMPYCNRLRICMCLGLLTCSDLNFCNLIVSLGLSPTGLLHLSLCVLVEKWHLGFLGTIVINK